MKRSNVTATNQRIGQRLLNLRLERNLSQQDVANIFGFVKRSIADYEKGLAKIPIENLQKLAIFFEKPISYFFDEEADALGRLEKKIDILFNMFIDSDGEVNQKLEIGTEVGLKDFLIAKGITDEDTLSELETFFRFACDKKNYNFDDIWNS